MIRYILNPRTGKIEVSSTDRDGEFTSLGACSFESVPWAVDYLMAAGNKRVVKIGKDVLLEAYARIDSGIEETCVFPKESSWYMASPDGRYFLKGSWHNEEVCSAGGWSDLPAIVANVFTGGASVVTVLANGSIIHIRTGKEW